MKRTRAGALVMLCSACFCAVMIAVPWEALRGAPFGDLESYTKRILTLRRYGLSYYGLGTSYVSLLSSEYLWFQITNIMALLPFEPRTMLAAVTVVSSFVYFMFTARAVGVTLAFIMLSNPFIIVLLNDQIRSAFAMSLILIAIMLTNRVWYVALVAVAVAYVHTSMLVMGGLYVAASVLARMSWSAKSKGILAAGGGIAFALLIAVVGNYVLAILGDRRAGATGDTKTTLYVVFWLLLGLFLVIRCTARPRPSVELLFAIILCTGVPLIEILGERGFRFLVLGYPFIIIATQRLDDNSVKQATAGVLVFQMLLFVYFLT